MSYSKKIIIIICIFILLIYSCFTFPLYEKNLHEWNPLAQGIKVYQSYYKDNFYSLVKIDLQESKIHFIPSKNIKNTNEFIPLKTSQFLEDNNLFLAFNFSPYYIKDNGNLAVIGLLSYEGKILSRPKKQYASIAFLKNNIIKINPDETQIQNSLFAFGSYYALVIDGNVKNQFKKQKHPRLVIGMDRDERYLYLLSVEGRGRRASIGLDLNDTAKLSFHVGMYNAINLDGGDSSTLVFSSVIGKKYINQLNFFKEERSVANHVGLYIGE